MMLFTTFLILSALSLSFSSFLLHAPTSSLDSPLPYEIFVDARYPSSRRVLSAPFSGIVSWYVEGEWAVPFGKPTIHEIYPFIEFVELMTATGGCYAPYPGCTSDRDLFNDPKVGLSSGTNFTRLITSLKNIVDQGLAPYIVTGNVPISMSSKPVIGAFGVNKASPDRFTDYALYIEELAKSLVATFSLDRVRQWRFGVLTEFNNIDWFTSKDDFLKLYDYTENALSTILGSSHLQIGTHACTQCYRHGEGWDPREFIDHVAIGTNYATGKKGTRITFLTNSFYESRPGDPGTLEDFDSEMSFLKDHVLKYKSSLPFLQQFGIDEGRILSGTEGTALLPREVGSVYQASFDSLFFDKMISNQIEYYARWNLNSGGIQVSENSVDSVSINLGRLTARMAGQGQILLDSNVLLLTSDIYNKKKVGAISSRSDSVIFVLIYHHDSNYEIKQQNHSLTLRITNVVPNNSNNNNYEAYLWKIDESHANWWSSWWKEMNEFNISMSSNWSKEGSDPHTLLNDVKGREYWKSRVEDYQRMGELKREGPVKMDFDDEDGETWKLELEVSSHSVVLVELYL